MSTLLSPPACGSEFSTINESPEYENRIDHNKNNILHNSCRYALMYVSTAIFYAALAVIDSKHLKALREMININGCNSAVSDLQS